MTCHCGSGKMTKSCHYDKNDTSGCHFDFCTLPGLAKA